MKCFMKGRLCPAGEGVSGREVADGALEAALFGAAQEADGDDAQALGPEHARGGVADVRRRHGRELVVASHRACARCPRARRGRRSSPIASASSSIASIDQRWRFSRLVELFLARARARRAPGRGRRSPSPRSSRARAAAPAAMSTTPSSSYASNMPGDVVAEAQPVADALVEPRRHAVVEHAQQHLHAGSSWSCSLTARNATRSSVWLDWFSTNGNRGRFCAVARRRRVTRAASGHAPRSSLGGLHEPRSTSRLPARQRTAFAAV